MQDADGNFGKEAVEAGMGYKPMEVAIPVDKDDSAPLEGTHDDLKVAASQIAERRQQEMNPLEIERRYNFQSGSKAGQQMPENETIRAEQAASDLSLARQQERAAVEAEADKLLADALNQLHSGQELPAGPPEGYSEQAQPQAPQTEAAQPEAAPQAEFDLAAELQKNPRLMAAPNQQITQANQQPDAMANYYAAAVAQNAQAAYASLISHFPELQGVTAEQLPAVVKSIKYQNPIRGSEVIDHLQRVQNLVGEHQRIQQAQAVAYQQQFNRGAKAADDALELYRHEQGVTDEQFSEIKNEVLTMLRESGMNDEQIAQRYNSDPMLRSFNSQKALMQAAQFRIMKRSAHLKRNNPVPQVQRPGSPVARGSDQDYSMRNLENKLNQTGSPKDAAALLAARRAARR
jgi:hypothetical protein